jgi:hypothetical protein
MAPFLAEFMDQRWIPASLHATLRDVLAFHLHVMLGDYYGWAAGRAIDRAGRTGVRQIAEIGAGSAGFSRTTAGRIRAGGHDLRVSVSDLHPQPDLYRDLEREYPGIVSAAVEPVDFLARPPAADAIVVLSAAFHHVPPAERPRMIGALAARRVMVFESVTKNALSMAACALGFLPAIATPVYFARAPSGRWRRVFWCWIVPVAPLMVAWDGVVSCLRCWTEEEWRRALAAAGVEPARVAVERRGLSHMIAW